MLVRDVHIHPVQLGKGRTFSSAILGVATANPLWDGGTKGGNDTTRPVLVVFAGSDQEIRPFVANAVAGRRVSWGGNYGRRGEKRLELLKSAGYEVAWQRGPEGSTATVFLGDLFRLDPGMVDPDGASFVALPRAAWLAEQQIACEVEIAEFVREMFPAKDPRGGRTPEPPTVEELRALVPLAHLFTVYLDRRTRCPILADGRFYLQLLVACLIEGIASFPKPDFGYWNTEKLGHGVRQGFTAEGLEHIGYGRGVAFQASHETIERVLAEQTTLFFEWRKAA